MPNRTKQKTCQICRRGDCGDCSNLEEITLVRLYTPKAAARAMLAGKKLYNKNGNLYFWNKDNDSFTYMNDELEEFQVTDFSGLFEELSDERPDE